ncbi:MAG: EAL domain-containing response regulator [Rhodospirillales bacterium]|nr:EAL domain-containing response regulator [Rhodospirillales bacterium]
MTVVQRVQELEEKVALLEQNPDSPSEKPRMLIVDDEPDICDLISFAGQGAGYDVIATSDPEQFASFYSTQTDVIVLDLSMPQMDGIELIRFLVDNNSEAAIILVSGLDAGVLGSAHTLALGQGLNVVGAIHKPLALDDLENLLKKAPRKKARDILPEENLLPEGTDELPSIAELRQAIEEMELFVVYQPKIEMNTRELSGVEALVRWHHKKKGVIPPSMFIPFAEQHGLIGKLTTLVITKALEQMGKWKDEGHEFKISINMSARTLTDLDFPDQLLSHVKSQGLKPEQLIIEITETSVLKNLMESLDILTRLRMKGFGLSIDDYGTGYSSMQQLQKIPFSELKVDQSFVMQSDILEEARTIVESTINLGRRLGMTVVAEGIETPGVWNLLSDLGCDQAQGFLMGRPMRGEDVLPWLNDWMMQGKRLTEIPQV